MKCIILAGGFARRLWPLTKYTPKPLLDVNGTPIIDHILQSVELQPEINEIIVSTNEKFADIFGEWVYEHEKSCLKPLKLVIEPTKEEKGKFGTIAGLKYIIEKENLKDDLMIIAGDNLFDFDIKDFIAFYNEKKGPVVAVFDLKSKERAMLYGIVFVNSENKIINFTEKSEEPESTLAATCCYIFPKSVLAMIDGYVAEGGRKDSPGFFIEWLIEKMPVYAFTFNGHWFDIGDFESLEEARLFMRGH